MTAPDRLQPPAFGRSLSARLLVLTVFFVMLSEVFVFAPSIARFRLVWLEERLAAVHLAALALEATPDGMVNDDMKSMLLHHAQAKGFAIHKSGRELALGPDMPPGIDAMFDLRGHKFFPLIGDAFSVLLRTDNRTLEVTGPSPNDPGVLVQAVVEEAPLRAAMIDYGLRILWLSVGISLFTATLVYLSLQWMMVRPLRRLAGAMTLFRERPEDSSRLITSSERADEIGVAERALADMQKDLRMALVQKTRLAALGAAMTRISHDLRGILASALAVSDRLESSGDPEVRRLAPTVAAAIERAAALCGQTLAFAREGGETAHLAPVALGKIVAEQNALMAESSGLSWSIAIAEDVMVRADADQMARVLDNLARNAAEAGAKHFGATARRSGDLVEIDLSDDGAGMPPKALANLFQPFAGSARAGGTGLGLAIARDLMRAQGGEIRLLSTGASGTVFRLVLPLAEARS